jgi:hypothetical protein
MVVEPVNGAPGDVFRHALHFIVVGPAIPTVEIALVLEEQIRGDGMEVTGKYARTDVRKKPASDFGGRPAARPIALRQRLLRAGIRQLLPILWEYWLQQRPPLRRGRPGSGGI